MAYYEIKEHSLLENPVLVVATEGWIDAGYAAATTVSSLVGQGSDGEAAGKLLAAFDDETFLDRRARRPTLHITDGVSEPPRWPSIRMVASKDMEGHDICWLLGPEPDFRWKSFVDSVLSICNEFGMKMAIGLGAFPAPVPHTRPVRLAATASSRYADMAKKVGVVRGTVEVPSGIWGPLEHALPDIGIPAVGLWARVPHYVATMPYPPASLSLLNGLCDLTGLSLPSGDLMAAADSSLSRINEIMGRSDEHSKMVKELEEGIDSSEGNPLDISQMPTGDEIATELERYLHMGHLLDAGDAGGGTQNDEAVKARSPMQSERHAPEGPPSMTSADASRQMRQPGQTGRVAGGKTGPGSRDTKGKGGADEVDEAQGDSAGSVVDDADATGQGNDMAGDAPDTTGWEDGLEEVEDYTSGLGFIPLEDGTFNWEDDDDDDDKGEDDWDDDDKGEDGGEDD
ncbi:MAG: PAC2 family protein [Actinobacteria bacterium]|nr:PAC2 family protein [Actinomycetota bacterium]MCL5446899.1 PAC2 family protein [Actinomycetota bacterium]